MGKRMRKFDFIDQEREIQERKELKVRNKQKDIQLLSAITTVFIFYSFRHLFTSHVLCTRSCLLYREEKQKKTVSCLCLQWFDLKSIQGLGIKKVSWAWVRV